MHIFQLRALFNAGGSCLGAPKAFMLVTVFYDHCLLKFKRNRNVSINRQEAAENMFQNTIAHSYMEKVQKVSS